MIIKYFRVMNCKVLNIISVISSNIVTSITDQNNILKVYKDFNGIINNFKFISISQVMYLLTVFVVKL